MSGKWERLRRGGTGAGRAAARPGRRADFSAAAAACGGGFVGPRGKSRACRRCRVGAPRRAAARRRGLTWPWGWQQCRRWHRRRTESCLPRCQGSQWQTPPPAPSPAPQCPGCPGQGPSGTPLWGPPAAVRGGERRDKVEEEQQDQGEQGIKPGSMCAASPWRRLPPPPTPPLPPAEPKPWRLRRLPAACQPLHSQHTKGGESRRLQPPSAHLARIHLLKVLHHAQNAISDRSFVKVGGIREAAQQLERRRPRRALLHRGPQLEPHAGQHAGLEGAQQLGHGDDARDRELGRQGRKGGRASAVEGRMRWCCSGAPAPPPALQRIRAACSSSTARREPQTTLLPRC